jgi:hypothetical protein
MIRDKYQPGDKYMVTFTDSEGEIQWTFFRTEKAAKLFKGDCDYVFRRVEDHPETMIVPIVETDERLIVKEKN